MTVPVWTSSLLLLPELQAALPTGRRVGVVTADAASLTWAHLRAAGAAEDTPLEGWRRIRHSTRPSSTIGRNSMPAWPRRATVAAALRLATDIRSSARSCLEMHQHAALR